MWWNTRWFLSKLVHQIGFQLSHVNGDLPHTFEWYTLQVQKNKHVALLMFMELEPRGAPIGRSRRKISQSKGASISGKLLLIYLASSEIIGFSRKSFSLIVSQEKKNNCISISVPYALSSIGIELLLLVFLNTSTFLMKNFKKKERKRVKRRKRTSWWWARDSSYSSASTLLGERRGERLGSIITDSVAMETDWLQRVGFV